MAFTFNFKMAEIDGKTASAKEAEKAKDAIKVSLRALNKKLQELGVESLEATFDNE